MTFNERYKDNIILIKSFEFSKNIKNFQKGSSGKENM